MTARIKGRKRQLTVGAEIHKLVKNLAFQTDILMEVLATELIERILKDDELTAEALMRIRQKYGLEDNPNRARRDE